MLRNKSNEDNSDLKTFKRDGLNWLFANRRNHEWNPKHQSANRVPFLLGQAALSVHLYTTLFKAFDDFFSSLFDLFHFGAEA